MTADRADVAIIGLGSAGEALASKLAGAGVDVVGFEPGRVGGECPFTACMPSKSLLHDAVNGVPWPDARRHRDEVVDHLDDAAHAGELTDLGVQIVRAPATIVAERVVEAGGRRWEVDHVVLATGSDPVIPPIDGLDADQVWTSDDLMVVDELPESLLILGGGAIGCEAATILAAYDRPVALIEGSDALLAGAVDGAVSDALARFLGEDGVDVHVGAEMVRVVHHAASTTVQLSTGEELSARRLLVAAGQKPHWHGLGLDAIHLDDDPPVDDEYCVGGLAWLRAIGDLNGRSPWTHGANHEAERLFRLLRDDRPPAQVSGMANCVFTSPPVGSVGRTAAAARDAGDGVVVGTARYSDVARFSTDGLRDGTVVVVADAATGALLGCSGIGAHFDDIVGVVAALIHTGATVEQAAALVLPFPTMAQVLTPAFQAAADARS